MFLHRLRRGALRSRWAAVRTQIVQVPCARLLLILGRTPSDKIKKFNDSNPYYHFGLGLKAYEAGHYTESIEQLRAALKLKATDQRFYLAIANDYVRLGALKEARKNVKLAMRLEPDASSGARNSQKLQWLAVHQWHTSDGR